MRRADPTGDVYAAGAGRAELRPEGVQADPADNVDPAGPLDLSRSYGEVDWWIAKQTLRARYAAWPAGSPWVVGDGDTAHDALADLARVLRAEPWCEEHSQTSSRELVRAAKRLSYERLVAYLKSLSAPA
jgi:hypothetical protein